MKPTDLYGKFDIGGGTMYAYSPISDDEDQFWRVVYERGGQVLHEEYIPMLYRPIFGYDAGDVRMLNERIEKIIVDLGLEDE